MGSGKPMRNGDVPHARIKCKDTMRCQNFLSSESHLVHHRVKRLQQRYGAGQSLDEPHLQHDTNHALATRCE